MKLKLYLVENLEQEYPACFEGQGTKGVLEQGPSGLHYVMKSIHAYTDLEFLEKSLDLIWFPHRIHEVEIELTDAIQKKIVLGIEAHQKRADVHPLTCGNDSNHILLSRIVDGNIELFCPKCRYVQKNIPTYFTDTQKEPDEK